MAALDPPTAPAACPFDPFARSYLADPYPTLNRLRREAPVFYARELDMWVVTRFADVERIFSDPLLFSAAIAQSPLFPLGPEARAILADGFRAQPTMSNCDPPKHGRIRAHNMTAFSAHRTKRLEPVIRERARLLVDSMIPKRRADLVGDLAFPLPALTIFTLIGFPDEDTDTLKSWCTDRMMFSWGRPSPEVQVQVARNMVAYWQYCERFVAGRLAAPRDDFTSDLLRIHLGDSAALSVDEITSVIYGLSFAGHETTSNLIGNCVRQLLQHYEQWEALCRDASLIPNAVEEVLRFDTSVVAWRRITTAPVVIGGVDVPARAKLMLVLAAANRDPDQFPDPDTFDLARPNARTHLAFGAGIHYCLGAALARLQTRVVLECLTHRLPTLRLTAGQALAFPPNISFRGPAQLWVEWDASSDAA